MKIALINCPQANPEKPPLSLAYLTAYLSKKNIQVVCFDFNIILYDESDAEGKTLWDAKMYLEWSDKERYDLRKLVSEDIIDKWAEKVIQESPDIIGFSLLSSNIFTSLRLAREIKNRDPKQTIVFGGPEAYRQIGLNSYGIFSDGDVLICGEGEVKLHELVLSFENQEKIIPQPGVLVKIDGIWKGTPEIGLVNDINMFPFPDYSFFPLEKYKKREEFPLIFSRGCCNRCVFCFESAYWKKFRCRNVTNVLEEIKEVQSKYGIRHFALSDSLMNGDMLFLAEFCERIIADKLNIEWWGMARIHPGMTHSFMKLMSEAGCKLIAYGIESGSQKVLNAIHKGYAVEIMEQVIINTHKAGIPQGINLMIGLPGEDDAAFQETCDFVKRNGRYVYYANMSILGVEPFTDLYAQTRDNAKPGEGINQNMDIYKERARKLSGIIDQYIGFGFNYTNS
jgi:radical SAM superfamily enzyme YgiQ (UPF0313 family)